MAPPNIEFRRILPDVLNEAFEDHILHGGDNAREWSITVANNRHFSGIVHALSKKHGLNPQLVAAVFMSGANLGYRLREKVGERTIILA